MYLALKEYSSTELIFQSAFVKAQFPQQGLRETKYNNRVESFYFSSVYKWSHQGWRQIWFLSFESFNRNLLHLNKSQSLTWHLGSVYAKTIPTCPWENKRRKSC